MHDPDGLNIGARHITISTVGIIPGIRRLAKEDLPVSLAVSLHAPDDALRRRLVPTQRHPIAELLTACRDYFEATSRRLTFEYALIAGENDSAEQARALGTLLRGLPCHVNLIPLNPTPDERYQRPSRTRVITFQRTLEAASIPCTVRVEKGVEIAAACGQLKGPKLQEAAGSIIEPYGRESFDLRKLAQVSNAVLRIPVSEALSAHPRYKLDAHSKADIVLRAGGEGTKGLLPEHAHRMECQRIAKGRGRTPHQ